MVPNLKLAHRIPTCEFYPPGSPNPQDLQCGSPFGVSMLLHQPSRKDTRGPDSRPQTLLRKEVWGMSQEAQSRSHGTTSEGTTMPEHQGPSSHPRADAADSQHGKSHGVKTASRPPPPRAFDSDDTASNDRKMMAQMTAKTRE